MYMSVFVLFFLLIKNMTYVRNWLNKTPKSATEPG